MVDSARKVLEFLGWPKRCELAQPCIPVGILSILNRPSTHGLKSNKSFIFFSKQTLKMGANDTSGQELQSALKSRRQTNFLRKLLVFEVRLILFSLKTGPSSFRELTDLFVRPDAANACK